MNIYKISFWFGKLTSDPNVAPRKVIVKSETALKEREIVLEGLKALGKHPRTYAYEIQSIQTKKIVTKEMDKLEITFNGKEVTFKIGDKEVSTDNYDDLYQIASELQGYGEELEELEA